MNNTKKDILELIRKASERDSNCWNQLQSVYYEDLYVEALKTTHHSASAKQAVQNAFQYAYDHFDELNNLQNFENWMKMLVAKEAEKEDAEYHPEEEKAEETPEIDLNGEERQEIVTEALDCLNDMEQTVLLMYGYDHKTLDDISTELNLKKEDTEKILGSAEKKVSAYIEKSGKNKKYEIAALPFFLAVLKDIKPEKIVRPQISAVQVEDIAAGNGYKEAVIEEETEVKIPHKVIEETTPVGKSIKTTSVSAGISAGVKGAIAAAAAVGVIGTGVGIHIHNSRKPENIFENALKNEIAERYGTADDFNLTSPYWYQSVVIRTQFIPPVLLSGNYEGQEGIITHVITDMDGDGEDELAVFYRKMMDPMSTGDSDTPYVNSWEFGVSIWENEDNQAVMADEHILMAFNCDDKKDHFDYSYYNYPEYFSMLVALKDVGSRKEILVWNNYDDAYEYLGLVTSTIGVAGYKYENNTVERNGGFNGNPEFLYDDQRLENMGFSYSELSEKLKTYPDLDDSDYKRILDAEPLYYIYPSFTITDAGVNRDEYKTAENHTNEDVSGYKLVLSTAIGEEAVDQILLPDDSVEADSSPEATAEPSNTEPSSTYDTSGYLSIMKDPSILLYVHGGYDSQYGQLSFSSINDEGDIYIAENQTLEQVNEYTADELNQRIAEQNANGEYPCEFSTLSDGNYGCAYPSSLETTPVWTGDIYIRKDAVISYSPTSSGTEEDSTTISFADFVNQGFEEFGMQSTYQGRDAVIDAIDDNGYVTAMTLVQWA